MMAANHETQPLLANQEGEQQQKQQPGKNVIFSGGRFLTGIIVVTVGLIGVFYFDGAKTNPSMRSKNFAYDSNLEIDVDNGAEFKEFYSSQREEVTIMVTNEYSNREGYTMFDYPFLKEAHLMEPHRESIVSVTGLSQECGTSWMLGSPDAQNSAAVSDGYVEIAAATAAVDFTIMTSKPGRYLLRLSQSCTGTSHEFTIYVKYVRRELMSLTLRDREEFLDAMKVLWDVDTVTGQKIYGARYKSLHYLAAVHNDAGANGLCDEFHGGTGFLNNHVMLGAFFEQSLQLVNPRTCLHYMEYSKYFGQPSFTEGHRLNQLDGGSWTELMTAAWFGRSDPLSGRILDGRWEQLQVPVMDNAFFEREDIGKDELFFPEDADRWFARNEYAHLYSPYGFIRSPWNYNSDSHLMRFNNVNRLINTQNVDHIALQAYNGLRCDGIFEYIQQDVIGQSLETAMTHMEDLPHAFAHWTVAGIGGDQMAESDAFLRERYGFDDTDLVFISSYVQRFRKFDYSTRMSQMGTYALDCSEPPFDYVSGSIAPHDEGRCDARSAYFTNETTLDNFLSMLFAASTTLPEFINTKAMDKLLALDVEKKANAVRHLANRMQNEGEMASSSAAMDPIFWVLHGAIERLFQRIVFEDVLGDMTYDTPNDCSGHNALGTKAWLKGYFFLDESVKAETLSNADLIDVLTPTSQRYADYVSFVYENREFSWCEGFDDFFSAK